MDSNRTNKTNDFNKILVDVVNKDTDSVNADLNAVLGEDEPNNAAKCAAGILTGNAKSVSDGIINVVHDNNENSSKLADGGIKTAVGVVMGDTNTVIDGLNTMLGDEPEKNSEDYSIEKLLLISQDGNKKLSHSFELPLNRKLGRILSSTLNLDYIKELNVYAGLNYGSVKITLHTHGVDIRDSLYKTTRIHWSQIVSMHKEIVKFDYRTVAKKTINSGVGKAAIGFALNDTKAIIEGVKQTANEGIDTDGVADTASKFVSSGTYFLIDYIDDYANYERNLIFKSSILDDGMIDEFIEKYNHEAKINRENQRKAFPFEVTSGTLFILVLLGVILLLILIGICGALIDSQRNTVVQNNESVSKNVVVEADDESKILNSAEWINESQNSCVFHQSGTTLSVTGTKSSDASLEIAGITINDCKTVDIAFDNQPSKSVKCSILDGKIRIEADRRLIKNMRGSANVKVTVSLDNGDGKIIQYSLKGFSKACEWTK